MPGQLESEEAARRLGVQVATLYAYVSRGLLVSHPAPTGRRRLFDIDEVERLARRSRRGREIETRMVTVTTGITQLTDDGPVYRGRRAVDLATTLPYEEVAQWLWAGGDPAAGVGVGAGPGAADVAGSGQWTAPALGAPPDVARPSRMSWAVVMAGALDRLRADLRPEAVHGAARRTVAAVVGALADPLGHTEGDGVPLVLEGVAHPGSIAERLTLALAPTAGPALVRAVNGALVLLADHELASSTMAVRVAASTRADVYDALLAGLGTMAGPLHGGASQLAYSLLAEAERVGVERALNDTLRWQGALSGFGHRVYTSGDARFGSLIGLFEAAAPPDRVELVRALVATAAGHGVPAPNVDLGLAAMTWATGMPPDAGWCLFTVARMAGWTAHYLEELEERPLRYRARAVYATPGPR